MAVLAPSRSFEGSDLSTNVFGRIIRDGLRVVNFRDDKNKEGAYFFILPPYKVDSAGRGVSWKVVPVRDNFGLDTKEMFAVPPNCPVGYFAGRARTYFPEWAKQEKTKLPNGRDVTKYPPSGRATNKVLFNVAYMNHLHLGSHLLTLPQFGGAEHIEAWGRRRMPNGSEAPLLNDPAAAIPVFIQLKKDAVGMPWIVKPEAAQTYQIPGELADADNLYNLDDAVHYPEIEYLLEKLQSNVPADIFNRCMAGYQLPNGAIIGNSSSVVQQPMAQATPIAPAHQGYPAASGYAQQAAQSFPAPTMSQPLPLSQPVPKAVIPNMGPPQPPQMAVEQVPSVITQNTGNPMAGGAPQFTKEQAKAWLQTQR